VGDVGVGATPPLLPRRSSDDGCSPDARGSRGLRGYCGDASPPCTCWTAGHQVHRCSAMIAEPCSVDSRMPLCRRSSPAEPGRQQVVLPCTHRLGWDN
jgi:hypothetical protein